MKLSDFGSNVYSQGGEDGVIAKIFESLGEGTRFCVEFGAWDGFHLSNTASLFTKGWAAVLIEASRPRYEALVERVAAYPCTCIHATVASTGASSLEALLDRYGLSRSIDFLSVDIDGDDYHVLDGLRTLRPRVICCEFNPTIPYHVEMVGAPGSGLGCSARALVELGKRMGYGVAAMTRLNCFLVNEAEFGRLSAYVTDPEQLFQPKDVMHLISAYDGRYLLTAVPPYGLSGPFTGKLAVGKSIAIPEGRLVRWARTLSRIIGRLRRRFDSSG
jgi:hypothetical protein